MRIGIDAKWYFRGNISGKVVIVNLINAIAENPGQHQYVIILDASDRERDFLYAAHPNFEIIYLKTFTNQLTNFVSPLLLKRFQLDVCVYQYFAPFFSSFKRVVYIHDIIFESSPEYFSWKEKLYFKAMKKMARRAQGVVTVSQTEVQRLKTFGYLGNQTKITAIHNGIHDQFHHLLPLRQSDAKRVKERYGLSDHYVLYLGRINKRKNIPSLIKAFKKIKKENVSLVIAGGKDWSAIDLEKLIVDEKLSGRVILTGFIQDEDVAVLYQLASAFCFLSFDEGFGLPVAEAMACGVPVVVSDTAINHEICDDAALFVDPNDLNAISDAICQALESGEKVQMKTGKGKKLAQAYQWSLTAERLVDFVTQL